MEYVRRTNKRLMKLKLCPGYLLVKPKKEQSSSEVLMVHYSYLAAREGTVAYVSDESGFSVGQEILFKNASSCQVGGEAMLFLDEEDILAIIN